MSNIIPLRQDKPMSEADERRIREKIADGIGHAAVAKQLEVPVAEVMRVSGMDDAQTDLPLPPLTLSAPAPVEETIPVKRKRRVYTAQEAADGLVYYRKSGRSAEVVASHLGVSENTLRRWIARAEAKAKARVASSKADKPVPKPALKPSPNVVNSLKYTADVIANTTALAVSGDMRLTDVAAKTGIPATTVWKWATKWRAANPVQEPPVSDDHTTPAPLKYRPLPGARRQYTAAYRRWAVLRYIRRTDKKQTVRVWSDRLGIGLGTYNHWVIEYKREQGLPVLERAKPKVESTPEAPILEPSSTMGQESVDTPVEPAPEPVIELLTNQVSVPEPVLEPETKPTTEDVPQPQLSAPEPETSPVDAHLYRLECKLDSVIHAVEGLLLINEAAKATAPAPAPPTDTATPMLMTLMREVSTQLQELHEAVSAPSPTPAPNVYLAAPEPKSTSVSEASHLLNALLGVHPRWNDSWEEHIRSFWLTNHVEIARIGKYEVETQLELAKARRMEAEIRLEEARRRR